MTLDCSSRANEALSSVSSSREDDQSVVTSAPTDPAWAWSRYQPDADHPWNIKWAGHLYRRAGFGANWDELRQAIEAGPQATIDRLLAPGPQAQEFNRAQEEYENAAAQSGSTDSLRAWWLRRMCQTPFPLQEKMTLFWHAYFGISNESVANPALMGRYLRVLRQNALGDFGRMLGDLSGEPALFAALNGRANRQSGNGENLSRVLLEQYTIGSSQFVETDVQAVARAFSGWFISQDKLRYSEREHVSKPGTFLGQTGDFNKEEVVRLLSRQKATAQRVVEKLYRWLISETSTPSATLLKPLVDGFGASLSIAALVETMLRSNLFFSTAAYRQKIKSPVEFALGIIRPFNGMVSTAQLGADLAGLGQDLFNPPVVGGWAGHTCWINRFTLIGRAKLAEALLGGSGTYGGKLDLPGAAAKAGKQVPEAAVRHTLEILLQGDVPPQASEAIAAIVQHGEGAPMDHERLRWTAIQIACLPEFHLA